MFTDNVRSHSPQSVSLGDTPPSADEATSLLYGYLTYLTSLYGCDQSNPNIQAEIQKTIQKMEALTLTPGVDPKVITEIYQDLSLSPTQLVALAQSPQPGVSPPAPTFLLWIQNFQSSGANSYTQNSAPTPEYTYLTVMLLAFLEKQPASTYTTAADNLLEEEGCNGHGSYYSFASFLDGYAGTAGAPSLATIEAILSPSGSSATGYQDLLSAMKLLAPLHNDPALAALNLMNVMQGLFNPSSSSSSSSSAQSSGPAASNLAFSSYLKNEEQKISATEAAKGKKGALQSAPPYNPPTPPLPDNCPNDPPNYNGNPAHDLPIFQSILAFYFLNPGNMAAQNLIVNSVIYFNNTGELTNDPSNSFYQAICGIVAPGQDPSTVSMSDIQFFLSGLANDVATELFCQDKDVTLGGWLQQMSASITGNGFFGSFFKDQFDNQLPAAMQDLLAHHIDANGNLYWDFTQFGITTRYYWNDPDGKATILAHVRGLDNTFIDNFSNKDGNGFNEMMKQFTTSYVNDLLKKYGPGAIFYIIMIMMSGGMGPSYDQRYNMQLGAQTQTTKDNTKFTNLIQQITNLFSNVGNFGPHPSGDDGMTIMKEFLTLAQNLDDTNSMSQVAPQVKEQISAIFNQMVPNPVAGGPQVTLEQVYQGELNGTYPAGSTDAAFNSLQGTQGAESPGYRAVMNALTSMGGALTQQSKAISTESNVFSQLINTVDNLGGEVSDSTKSYQSFINQLIKAQAPQ